MIANCVQHPGAAAGWRCDACDSALCPACTAWQHLPSGNLERCTRCGGLARAIRVPRGELHPYSVEQLLEALKYPFNGPGLLVVFSVSVVLWLFGLIGAYGIARGLALAFLFQIVRHTALGHDDRPGPEDFTSLADLALPSLRFFIALAWIWLPLGIWNYLHPKPSLDPIAIHQKQAEKAMRPGGGGMMMQGKRVIQGPNGLEVVEADAPPQELSESQKRDKEALEAQDREEAAAQAAAEQQAVHERGGDSPWVNLVPAVLILLGIFIVPMSLLLSSLQTPFHIVLNPVLTAGYAVRLGKDYQLAVGFCATLVAAALLWTKVDQRWLATIPLHSFVASVGHVTLQIIFFRGIGLLVRARGADLGYGSESDYLVNVLGDAQPMIDLAAQREASGPAPVVFDSAGNPVSSEQQAQRPRTTEPIEIELSPSHAALPDEDPNDALVRLLALEDLAACFAVLEADGAKVRPQTLAPQTWFELGKKALEAKSGKAASFALKRCLDAAPTGPHAPRAWLLAARVYDELLGDRKTSNRLLGELVKRFPETQEGQFAQKRLGPPAAPKA
ncbi:MAG: hypothetical protein JST92_10125 [Deltaproteobacteria bacterium]|nr:hypothetical protein [Deltaproteobacteria bacterium]